MERPAVRGRRSGVIVLRKSIAIGLFLLALPLTARAASILVYSGESVAASSWTFCVPEFCFPLDDSESGNTAEDFDASVGSGPVAAAIHVDSDGVQSPGCCVIATTIDGTGSASLLSTPSDAAYALSHFAIEFSVDQDSAFVLEGLVDGSTGRIGEGRFGFETSDTPLAGAFLVQGQLQAGQLYHIELFADVDSDVSTLPRSESYQFHFALVPEPSTLGMFALGVAWLTQRRRKHC